MTSKNTVPGEKGEILKNLEDLRQDLKEVNDFIHGNPELGHEEIQAVRLLTGKLKEHGFTLELGAAGLPTAFVAEYRGRNDGPTIAFVAEYDALPDLGHGCGHNIIATSALGAGLALAPLMAELHGCIRVIGTPAEDTTADKIIMIERGVFKDVDFSMQCHPNDRTMTGARFKAMHKADFLFHGRAAHTSRAPEKGISALDGVMLTFTAIEYLREHVRRDAQMSGIVTHGGTAPNIVPDFASASFVFRSDDRGYLNEVVERAYNCARGAALATGADLEILKGLWLDSMLCLSAFDKAFMENALLLDPPQVLPQTTMASTDFANLSTVLPSSRLEIAFVPPGTSTHSREFAEAGRTEAAYRAIDISAFAMAATALDLMLRPDLAAAIAKEHAELAPVSAD